MALQFGKISIKFSDKVVKNPLHGGLFHDFTDLKNVTRFSDIPGPLGIIILMSPWVFANLGRFNVRKKCPKRPN